ncbi:hypothetical protein DNTS_016129 [Danionella cerebrum]|uniref:Pericentrin/AKAP-450 centrosomal targeting domain-containing protein n=1 Tax=Danionella cerebrum TaxID=2873325 RepID=A0A553Q8R6_9TELE|nr:hypothetical protein DNTS_016129 [Danionella translucida]
MRLQLQERHQQELEQLRASLSLSCKEELLQARTDLTDRYYKDIDQLNTKHAHELEQLRAKLSENHIKEINKMRLQSAQEAARQVESEVKDRIQEHQAIVSQLENQLSLLSQTHSEELRRVAEEHREQLRQMEETVSVCLTAGLYSLYKRATVRILAGTKHCHKAQTYLSCSKHMNLSEISCFYSVIFNNQHKKGLAEEREAERNHLRAEENRLKEKLLSEAEENFASQREELQKCALDERAELEQRILEVQAQLTVESERLEALQKSLECEENPQLVAVKQKLQAQYDRELYTAKSAMAAEVKELNALLQDQLENKLQEVLCRHQEEQKGLEEKLTLEKEAALVSQREQHAAELQAQKALREQLAAQLEHLEQERQELKTRHQEELESLMANHQTALDTLEMDLVNTHKVELDKLQAVFQETNLAQLEAQEAELHERHTRVREELEERLMTNMDTLETTYLQEIQTVRDEKDAELRAAQELYASELERVTKEKQTLREELRGDLAKVHIEKFSSMAAELHQAHQAEMAEAVSSQRAALEDEHRSALDALQQQVVNLEQQHSAALQGISDLASAERRQLEKHLEELKVQHQEELQQLKGVSARELEALRRELEEEAPRQRLHFLEEVELHKCKLEEQLQQRMAQLKEESVQERAAALEELENTLRRKQQQTERAYTEKMSQLTTQLQQLDSVVSQLRAEVCGLQGELEGKRAEMDTMETLLQRRERENQEGDNLMAMLQADLSTATEQRRDLQTARDKLQRLLIEMLRITMATEDHISRKIGTCASGVRSEDKTPSHGSQETGEQLGGVTDADLSSAVDEGLELSQRLCESVFSGPEGEMEAEGEELMLEACTRLRAAVDKLLELLSQSTHQLEQMCGLQAVLSERFRDGGEAGASLLFQNSQLLEQLDHEAGLKSQLQLELHKAEGLLDGYVAEKALLEEALQQKEVQEQRLAEELEHTRSQLKQLSENHTLLLHQREALTSGLGDTEKGFLDDEEETALLEEAERLGRECVEVQRQAEKDCGGLASRLQMLEQALEEQESRAQQLEEQHRLQTEDLQQHIHALEKQLKHNRQFIDVREQAVEREHERDEFQQEIKNLEAQLRHPSKGQAAWDGKGQGLEDLVLQVCDPAGAVHVLVQ